MLVVIAVIAALMSILVPSLNVDWEQARCVQCCGNIRTLTPAWLMYEEENDGSLGGGHPQESTTVLVPAPWVVTPRSQRPPAGR